MPEKVIIYGKDTCPYTSAARDEYAKKGYDVEYINVKASTENMEKMLKAGGGQRTVPVIVEGGRVIHGFGGT
ncbi:MAG: glutaredoxin [Deltaproteobacteria bacterium]|nr:glutaredoxin [Deltaproteobacteria bacterium]